jgi:hypothetical protein
MRKVKSRPMDWAGPDLERYGQLKNLNNYHLITDFLFYILVHRVP